MTVRSLDLAPDRILFHGRIITMDGEQPAASAVAIKDGRFVAVGDDADVLALAGPSTQIEDLNGAQVTPGMIDAHNHLYRTGRTIKSLRLHDVRSIRELQERLAGYVKTAPRDQWVVGGGWNESLLAEGRFPTRWDLDEVAPDIPVVLNRTWNKLVANSLALELCGVDRNTPWPPLDLRYPGEILRDSDGEITGVLTDRAKHLVLDKIPFSDAYIQDSIIAACKAYNAMGLTSVIDPGLRPEEMRGFQAVLARGELSVRTSLCVSAWGHTGVRIDEEPVLFDRVHGIGVYTGFGDEFARLDCVKIMPDGGGSDGTALMYEDFFYKPGYRGEATVDPDQIAEFIWFSHERGWSVDAHCCGDRMQDIVAEGMAAAYRRMPSDRIRHRIHHAYLPTERSLALMAEFRIAAVTQPIFLWSQGESMYYHFGEEVARGLMPARTYLDRGIPVAFSSDSGVADFNPWVGIYAALTRRSITGREFDQGEIVSREEALRAYTQDAAWITFEEEQKGSVTPGKLADLVIVDRDLLTCPLEEIKEIRPVATMMGGEWVFRRGS